MEQVPISLGSTKQDVLTTLGTPEKTTQENGRSLLWYNSIVAIEADIYYFENDLLVFKGLYVADKTELKQLIETFGPPAKSIQNHAKSDSFREVVHMWPDLGVAFIARGQGLESSVIRKEEFAPTSLNSYLSLWRQDLLQNSEVVIASPLPSSPTTPTSISQSTFNTSQVSIIVAIILVVLFTLVFYLHKKNKKRN